MNNILNYFKDLNNLPKELKYFNYLKAGIAFTWAMLFAIAAKLEGLLLPLSVVSFFILLARFSSIFLIFFKKLSFTNIYKIILFIDISYLFGTILFYFNPVWFLWFNGIIGAVYAVSLSAFYFSLNELIAKIYTPEILKNFQYMHEYSRLVGGVLSLLLLMLINDVKISFILFQICLFVTTMFSITYYYKIVKIKLI